MSPAATPVSPSVGIAFRWRCQIGTANKHLSLSAPSFYASFKIYEFIFINTIFTTIINATTTNIHIIMIILDVCADSAMHW